VNPLGRQHAIDALVDGVYREPEPLDSAEEFARFHHDDVKELALAQIDAERLLARLRWAALVHCGAPVSSWLQTRLAVLDGAAARHRGAVGGRR
jgi:hypothetical protein